MGQSRCGCPKGQKVEKASSQRLDPHLSQGPANRLPVVDHESNVTAVVSGLRATLLQGEELIAKIKKGGGFASATEFEVKQSAVKRQRLVDIADLERHVIQTDGPGFLGLRHGISDRRVRVVDCVIPWQLPKRGAHHHTPHSPQDRLKLLSRILK